MAVLAPLGGLVAGFGVAGYLVYLCNKMQEEYISYIKERSSFTVTIPQRHNNEESIKI